MPGDVIDRLTLAFLCGSLEVGVASNLFLTLPLRNLGADPFKRAGVGPGSSIGTSALRS